MSYSENIIFFSIPTTVGQQPVDTFADLATTFPSPIVGETHTVIDEGLPYYWTGASWEAINNSGTLTNVDGGVYA